MKLRMNAEGWYCTAKHIIELDKRDDGGLLLYALRVAHAQTHNPTIRDDLALAYAGLGGKRPLGSTESAPHDTNGLDVVIASQAIEAAVARRQALTDDHEQVARECVYSALTAEMERDTTNAIKGAKMVESWLNSYLAK